MLVCTKIINMLLEYKIPKLAQRKLWFEIALTSFKSHPRPNFHPV